MPTEFEKNREWVNRLSLEQRMKIINSLYFDEKVNYVELKVPPEIRTVIDNIVKRFIDKNRNDAD